MNKVSLIILFVLSFFYTHADDGYRLWLRYDKIDNPKLLQEYSNAISGIQINASSATLSVAKQELLNDLQSLLGEKIAESTTLLDKCMPVPD